MCVDVLSLPIVKRVEKFSLSSKGFVVWTERGEEFIIAVKTDNKRFDWLTTTSFEMSGRQHYRHPLVQ